MTTVPGLSGFFQDIALTQQRDRDNGLYDVPKFFAHTAALSTLTVNLVQGAQSFDPVFQDLLGQLCNIARGQLAAAESHCKLSMTLERPSNRRRVGHLSFKMSLCCHRFSWS